MQSRRKGSLTLLLVAVIASAYAGQVSAGETKTKLARKNGEVHAKFLRLIDDLTSQFDNGVGRIELVGSGGFAIDCSANLYVSKETTYVTLKTTGKDLYDEFYIDHPKQSFSNILFQTFIQEGKKETVRVDEKDGGYSIARKGDKFFIQRRKNKEDSPECRFTLSKAKLYPNETE